MKVGTKSLLFGVHQFVFHPWTVLRAWRKLYGGWPDAVELCAIIVHDWGYWGSPNMDGPEGERHPFLGAKLTARFALWLGWSQQRAADAYFGCLYHSRFLAAKRHAAPSLLCWADKLSVVYDPGWFYLLRARASGELAEYRQNAKRKLPLWFSDGAWFRWYRRRVLGLVANKTRASATSHRDE
jgi:hypothetical protein